MIPSFSDWAPINEAKAGERYAARVEKLLEKAQQLQNDFYRLKSDLKSEEAPTSVLRDQLENIAGSVSGNVAYTIGEAMKYGRSVVYELRKYDEEVARVRSIKLPNPAKLAKLADEHARGYSVSADAMREWLVNAITIIIPGKDAGMPDNYITRALVRSVHDRAADDFRTKTGRRWKSDNVFAKEVATPEEQKEYGARYVKELNSLLRPFGLIASDVSMVYWETLILRKL